MRKKLLLFASLLFSYCYVQGQCNAYAGTMTLSNDGSGNIPRAVCFGSAVALENNGDYVLPPAAPGRQAGVMLGIFSCPPTSRNNINAGCWTGWYWTGESFVNSNTGEIQSSVGINEFWFAPIAADAAGANPNHDANNDGCYDIGIDQAQYFIFLDEIRVQNTTTAADRCQGRATLVISGGSPIFRTQPARSLGGLYNVVNSGGGTMNLSGAHNQNVEITGLSSGDLISIDITDPNGCTTSYTFNFIGAPQPAFTFNDFCAGSNNNRPTAATPVGGRYSFSPAPTDGAAINPITGVITNGVPGTTYYVVYTTTGSCQVSTPPQAVMVLPRSPTPIIPADQRNFEVCLGESAILTPEGGSNFRLYNNPNYTGLRATGSSFNLAQFGTPGQLTAFYVTSIDGCESDPVLVTITIIVPVSPVVDPLVYNLCRGEEVTIRPTSTVGVTEFEYYSNAALTNQLGIGASFTFTPNNTMQVFIVQYVNGCRSNPVSVSIVVSLPPNRPTVNAPAPICVGTAIPTLNATGVSGTVQVQWFTTNPTTGNPTPVFTGTSFTPAINNNTAGIYNYWVRIRNTATGCIGEAAMTTISIFDTPPAPVVTIDSVVICTGGSIPTFTASGVGGTLRWYNTDPSVGNPAPVATGTSFNPTVSNATPANLTYWVLEAIGTGNCVGPARRVRLSILPQTARPIATPDSLRICTNAAAPVLSAISSNGSIRWYDMDPNTAGAMPIANGNTFIPSLNTTAPNTFQYWAIAISDTTCQSTSTRIRLFVDAPPATPTVDNARQICTGETIPAFAANGTGGTLNWYNANPGTGNPAPIHTGTNLTPNIDNSTAGIFNLWVTETNTTGCVSAAAITSLTINARPAAPVVAAPAAICTGEVIPTLNVTGLSIRWYNTNPTTGNPTPIATGNNFTPMLNNNISGTFTYWATAINATGCEGTAASVNLTINARPGAPVAANPTPICAGETLPSLSANTNTAALNWYNTNPTTGTATPIGSGAVFVPNLNNTPPGDYNFWVTATSADGCEGVATLLTVRINAVPNAPQAISPQQICLGETIPSLTANGAGGIIRWYDSDPTTGNPSSIATGNTFTPLVSNNNAGNFTYWITETNATGCQSAPDITTLTINDQLDAPAVITPAPICVDEDIPTLSATSTGGTLQWYNSNPATGNPMVIATGEAFTPNIANNVPGNFDFWVTETSLSGCVGLPALLTIRINNQPNTPQAIDPAPICANDPLPAFTAVKGDGVLNWYNANPATGSATFLGSGDSFTPAIDNTLAGNYTFWVQENNGCIGDATSLTLIINTLPEAPQANPPIPICAGQAIPTLSSSASGVINWYDENPTNSTSNSIATGLSFTPGLDNMVVGDFSFWITQTDGNGCVSAPTSITLTINALPQAPQASDPAAICAEQAIPTLSTAAPGTVRWYDANPALGNPSSIGTGATFTPNLNNALAGNYTFWLNQTDGNGCVSAPASITLTINALPQAPQASDPAAICAEQAIPTLGTTALGTVRWYDANPALGNPSSIGTGATFTPNLNNALAGNYTFWLNQTDGNGCVSAPTSITLTINALPQAPQASDPAAICAEQAIPTLSTAAPGTVRWYDANPALGNPSSIGTGATFTPNLNNALAGNYTFWLNQTDGNGCVSAPASITLTINALPQAPQASDPAAICAEQAIPTLSTAAPGTVRWYDANPALGNPSSIGTGATFTPNLNNALAGNYTFWLNQTDGNGCVSAPASITLTINALPQAPQASDPAAICAEQAIPTLSTAAPGTVRWYDANPALGNPSSIGTGATFTPNLNNALAGNYTFWLNQTDGNGCVSAPASITLTINALPQVPQASDPAAICAEQAIPTLSTTALGTVRWYDANPALGNPSSISTGATFTPNLNNALAGNYTFWLNQTDGNGCVSAPASITLTINALPQAPQASDPAAICAEQAIPTLSTTALGTVRWYDANPALGNPSSIGTGATFTPNLNNALAGNYTFWLNQTDGNGCVSAPTSITLTINALPVLNVSNTIDPGCNLSNGSIAVNATGDGAPFNYQLNNGPLNGTGIFSNLDAGNYTIRVQDSRGCTDAITTLLVAPNGVVAIAGENRQLTCLTPNLTLDGSASTGPNGFSYEWTRDGAVISTAPAFNVSEGGTYILTVAFEGCINRDTVVITNNIRDIVATINPSATQLTCAVNNILLDGSASTNGANMQYEWQHNNTAISGAIASRFDATLPGTYRLIVTDNSNSCTNAATFDIVENRQLPQVNAGADQLLNCNMPTANLSGTATANGPLAYAWLNSSGAVLSNTNTLQANVPGAYVLRVTNMENSCVNEDQVQINSDFDYPVANAGNGGQLDCVVTELSLGGTGTSTGSNFSLSWRVLRSNAPAPQPIATPVVSNPGLYVLTVINNRNGCTTSDSVLVTQVLPDNLNFQVLVTPPSCTGRNNDARIRIIPQDNTATFVYRIGRNTPFSSQNAFTEVRAGTYLLVAQDIYGCEWDTTVTIEPITPVQVNLGGNRIVRLGEDVQLEAMLNLPSNMIRSVQWLNPERLSCADCLTPRIEALMEPLTPAIFVTDVNGCTAQASINIFINKERRVFVPTAFSPNGDGSNDRLVFFGGPDVRSVKSMQIFTRWGEKVFEMRDFQPNDPEYGWDGTFRGAGNRTLNPGVFVYVAEVEFIDGEVEIFKGDVTLIK